MRGLYLTSVVLPLPPEYNKFMKNVFSLVFTKVFIRMLIPLPTTAINAYSPIPVAERSKAWVCGRSLIEIVGSNPPIPVAVRSPAWVFGRSLTTIVGSNPTGDMDICVAFVV
jgi:hypothetical protein